MDLIVVISEISILLKFSMTYFSWNHYHHLRRKKVGKYLQRRQ